MAVKLIATDLDGTLMAPDHMTVTERTKTALIAAVEHLRTNGHPASRKVQETRVLSA